MSTAQDVWGNYEFEVLDQIPDRYMYFEHLEQQMPWANGWVTACCPFHDDPTQSFAFERTTGNWNCSRSCGQGKLFDYIAKYLEVTFEEAVLAIGDEFNVPRPDLPARPKRSAGLPKTTDGD